MERKGSRTERLTVKFIALCFGAALLAAPAVSAQYAPPKQQPAAPAGQTAQPAAKPGEPAAAATPPVNKEEEDAAKAFFDLKIQDTAQTIQAGEDLLQKFPESRYRDSVYAKLLHAYLNAGKEDKVMPTGEKALGINPDNVDVLAFMSWYMGHRYNPNALDAEQRLQTTQRYGRRALELIASMQKPAGVSDEDFARAKAEKQAMSHTGIALTYYHQNKNAEMTAELEQATALDPTPDPLGFFLLGAGELQMKKYAEAMAAYEKCSQVAWVYQGKCKSGLAQVKAIVAAQPAPAAAPTQPAPAAQPATQPAPAAVKPAPAADPAKPKPPEL